MKNIKDIVLNIISVAAIAFILAGAVQKTLFKGESTVYSRLISDVAGMFSNDKLSGTIKRTSVEGSYVFLYLSMNDPCDIVAVPITFFKQEFIQAGLAPNPNAMVLSYLNIGSHTIGEKIVARGEKLKLENGRYIIVIDSANQIQFKD